MVGVMVRIRFSVWLVSGHAHVFVQLCHCHTAGLHNTNITTTVVKYLKCMYLNYVFEMRNICILGSRYILENVLMR